MCCMSENDGKSVIFELLLWTKEKEETEET